MLGTVREKPSLTSGLNFLESHKGVQSRLRFSSLNWKMSTELPVVYLKGWFGTGLNSLDSAVPVGGSNSGAVLAPGSDRTWRSRNKVNLTLLSSRLGFCWIT